MSDYCDFTRGLNYADLMFAAQALENAAVHREHVYDRIHADSAETFVSRCRAALSQIDRAIEEARERMSREHNQKVAAE